MKQTLITSAIVLALLSSVAQATEVTTPVTIDVAAAFSQGTTKVEVATLTSQEMKTVEAAGFNFNMRAIKQWFAYAKQYGCGNCWF